MGQRLYVIMLNLKCDKIVGEAKASKKIARYDT